MTLEQVKQHLVIEDTKDDTLINTYISAGKATITNYLHEEYNEESKTQNQALLLLVANWYANREATVSGTIISKLPYGVEFLLDMEKRMLI